MQRLALTKAVISVVLAALITATVTTVAFAGGATAKVIPAKTFAERCVLGVLGRNWGPSRVREFIDARTRLPFDNVQATAGQGVVRRLGRRVSCAWFDRVIGGAPFVFTWATSRCAAGDSAFTGPICEGDDLSSAGLSRPVA
jgi:hypothetical protein